MATTLQSINDDEEYNSASDDDFAPDAVAPDANDSSTSSDDDDDDNAAASVKKSRHSAKKRANGDEALDFANSGDEATISKARKKRKKVDDDDDEGGEGGLIKTRAQRRAELQEKKPLASIDNTSVDVDALWAQMASGATSAASTIPPASNNAIASSVTHPTATGQPSALLKPALEAEKTITIKRTYEFAGEIMTEEKTVPASSEEARVYLVNQNTSKHQSASTSSSAKPALRRPIKRKSMFASTGPADVAKGPKLNTLEKSKLDWAAHVDQEGMAEELSEARRAKDGYLGRQDFLGRMDARRDDELKNLKQK